MSELNEQLRHLRRVWANRKLAGGRLSLPKPLDLVVMTHNRVEVFEEFIETLLQRTHWPLRIHLCDAASTDSWMLSTLKKWENRKAGIHEVRVSYQDTCEFPHGFNLGLRDVQGEVFAVSDSDIIVPDLGKTCWATELLYLMQAHPHLGWLALDLAEQVLPGQLPTKKRFVRGTQRKVWAYPCETQTAIMRRDLFQEYNGNFPEFPRLLRDHVHSKYAVGVAREIVAEQRGWNYVPQKEHSSLQQLVIKQDSIPDVPFYVITRTHHRPNLFKKCRESIERQTKFGQVVHIITYSDDKDLEYIPNECVRVKVEARPDIPCYYETYINAALDVCDDGGFVMVLDDDDYLYNRNIVKTFLNASQEIDAAFFRVAIRQGSFIPKRLPFENPIYGDLASCGWVLRTEIAKQERWKPGHAQDFGYINQIFRFHLLNQKRIAWSSSILARTQAGVNRGTPTNLRIEYLEYLDETIDLYV